MQGIALISLGAFIITKGTSIRVIVSRHITEPWIPRIQKMIAEHSAETFGLNGEGVHSIDSSCDDLNREDEG